MRLPKALKAIVYGVCSKGRKHGGKLVTLPTDLSDVLEFQLHAAQQAPGVRCSVNQALNRPVVSVLSHPGRLQSMLQS